MKTKQYECPNCHEVEEVIGRLNECMEVAETKDGDLYEFVTLNCRCYKCGHEWEEYARLTYDGFYDKETHNVYNADGSVQYAGVFV